MTAVVQDHSRRRAIPFSTSLWLSALLLEFVVLCPPLFTIEFPPLSDLGNHLARLYILSTYDKDPILSRRWHSDWHLVPNLAIDIIGPPLIGLTSLASACRVVLIAIVASQLSGTIRALR
jgi:hypothetical protein